MKEERAYKMQAYDIDGATTHSYQLMIEDTDLYDVDLLLADSDVPHYIKDKFVDVYENMLNSKNNNSENDNGFF